MESMHRREFLVGTAVAIAGAGAFLAGCGGSTTGTGTGTCGTTYTNPGHAHTTAALSATQLANAVAGNYTLMGGDHSHAFSLTAADFTALKSRGTVQKTDSDGHGHIISITC